MVMLMDRQWVNGCATSFPGRRGSSKAGLDPVSANILAAAKDNAISYIRKKAARLTPAQVNVTDQSGNTPLHYACINSHAEMARMLLRLGADPNARNKEGNTPLHEAFRRNSTDLAGAVLDAGGDPSVPNKERLTPLYFATPELARKFGLKNVSVFYGNFDGLRKAEQASATQGRRKSCRTFPTKVLDLLMRYG